MGEQLGIQPGRADGGARGLAQRHDLAALERPGQRRAARGVELDLAAVRWPRERGCRCRSSSSSSRNRRDYEDDDDE